MESLSKSEKDLLADCTCPVCQEVFVNPQQLTCRHTLCRKCVNKMAQKSEEAPDFSDMVNPFDMLGLFSSSGKSKALAGNSSGKRTLRCPICRESCERFEPDEAIESMVRVLRLLKDSRCRNGPEECWAEATVLCSCCDKHYCQKHYELQLAALQTAGESLCQGIRSLLSRDGPEEQQEIQQLENTQDAAKELEKALIETLQQSLAAFNQQVQDCRAQLEAPPVSQGEVRAELERDHDAVTMLLKRSDLVGLARVLPQATERLKAVQREHPPRVLALQFEPDKVKTDLIALMSQMTSSTYRAPYKGLPKMLNRVQARGLSQKPWDIGILFNLEGVVCADGALKLVTGASSASPLPGPLLVINVQHFPTKMLHVTDMDVKQVATIKLQFGQEGMPGRMHVYNERQLILTSDAGRHKVSVFNLEGKLQISFGQKGDAPGHFHTPLGISASNGHMFVVDSKNKRIQVFDMDSNYDCLAIILHDKFSNGIHSIATNQSSIFVVDRNESTLFVFDRETRLAVSSKFNLGGQPFDILPDEFGNAFVTLIEDGKVQIVHRLGVLQTMTFKETHENHQPQQQSLMLALMPMMQSGTPPHMFHGIAYDHTRRRLYIADLMRSCIIVADLSY